MGKGKLYGVSVGPGDPELMTLKAVRIIREADVIALPHKDKEKCVSYKIAVQSVPEMDEKEFLMIHMPMTKDREQLKKAHEDGVNAVAEMLDRKCTYIEIAEKTGASTATISRVNRALTYGMDGYKLAIDRVRENSKKADDSEK